MFFVFDYPIKHPLCASFGAHNSSSVFGSDCKSRFFAMAEERKYNYYNCVDGMDKYDTTYVVREPD